MAQIAVIGSGGELPEDIRALAEEIGREIALAKAVLICGGRDGVMEAACKGAKEKGGTTVAILPSSDPNEANQCVDVKIPTGLGLMRNTLIVRAADAVIAVKGATGTLVEAATALNEEKPLILLETSGGVAGNFDKVLEIEEVKNKYGQVFKAKTAKEAVEIALKA